MFFFNIKEGICQYDRHEQTRTGNFPVLKGKVTYFYAGVRWVLSRTSFGSSFDNRSGDCEHPYKLFRGPKLRFGPLEKDRIVFKRFLTVWRRRIRPAGGVPRPTGGRKA